MRAQRNRVIATALLISILCHLALLVWLPASAARPSTNAPILLRLVAWSQRPPAHAAQLPAAPEKHTAETVSAPRRGPGARPSSSAEKAAAEKFARPAVRPAPPQRTAAALLAGDDTGQRRPLDGPNSHRPPWLESPGAVMRQPENSAAGRIGPDQPATHDATAAGLQLAIRERLASFLRYPPAARRRSIEGDPVVLFIITREGELLHRELARSSGSRHLDQAALRLVAEAAPYPGFPADLELAQLEIRVPIEYRLRPGPSS